MVNTTTRFRGGWVVEVNGGRGFVGFDPAAYAGYTFADTAQAFIAPERLDNAFNVSFHLATPTFRFFNGDLRMQRAEVAIFPEASEGRETRIISALEFRPTSSIRVGLTATYSRITRRGDGSEFARTLIPRIRTEYQPNRALFSRFVGEYQSQRRAGLFDAGTGLPLFVGGAAQGPTQSGRFRMDWLASFEPTPGTVAFLGYGATLLGPSATDLSDLTRSVDGFFLKLAYLFRR